MSGENSFDLLNELSSGEDEFDVDLMACGCRLAAPPELKLSVDDIVRLYELRESELRGLIDAMITEANIPADVVFRLASKVAEARIPISAPALPTLTLKPSENPLLAASENPLQIPLIQPSENLLND